MEAKSLRSTIALLKYDIWNGFYQIHRSKCSVRIELAATPCKCSPKSRPKIEKVLFLRRQIRRDPVINEVWSNDYLWP
jgi:hypothetical protein